MGDAGEYSRDCFGHASKLIHARTWVCCIFTDLLRACSINLPVNSRACCPCQLSRSDEAYEALRRSQYLAESAVGRSLAANGSRSRCPVEMQFLHRSLGAQDDVIHPSLRQQSYPSSLLYPRWEYCRAVPMPLCEPLTHSLPTSSPIRVSPAQNLYSLSATTRRPLLRPRRAVPHGSASSFYSLHSVTAPATALA
jgi:hypothetical protein